MRRVITVIDNPLMGCDLQSVVGSEAKLELQIAGDGMLYMVGFSAPDGIEI